MAFLALPKILIELQVPLLYLTNIVALAIGPKNQVLRFGITLPYFGLLLLQSLHREWTGTWGIHYAVECTVVSAVFIYFDWNILGSPDKDGWKKIPYGEDETKTTMNGHLPGKEMHSVPQGFWERAWWGVRLATGNRYVGWSQEVKNVPKEVPANYPRVLFIFRKALRFVLFYLLRDIAYSYTASSPYGSWSDIVHVKPITSLSSQPFLTRFWFVWVHIFITYTALEQTNAAYGAVSVLTRLANPRDCPSAFGDLSELVSVRNAWSSVWHQQCRRICSAPGIYIARDVLQLRRGSFASKYLQLFIGFGISAIVHGCASMLIHRSFNDDGAFIAFVGQAVIIMIEDHVIDLGKKMGIEDSTFWRLVGSTWTVFAIGASFAGWTSRIVDNGMWVHDRARDVFGIGPQMIM